MSSQESPPGPQELSTQEPPPTKSRLVFFKYSALIFSNLPQRDQAQCALVCRSWSTIAITKLWSTISITDRRAYYRFLTPEAQEALIKNCHFVRSFRTNYISVVQSLISSAPLTTSSTNPADDSSELTTDETLCHCSNLVHLDLGGLWRVPPPPKKEGQENTYQAYNQCTPRPPLTPQMEQLIYRVIQSNPHLKDLIIGSYISDRDGLLGILTHEQLAELETLDLFHWHGGYFHHGNPDKLFTEMFLEQSPRSLRELSMVLNAVETSEPLRYYIRNTKSSPQRPRLEPVSVPGSKLFSAPSSEHVTIKLMHNFSRPRTVRPPWQAHHTLSINGATDFADHASVHPSKSPAQSATESGSNNGTCVVIPSLTDQDSLEVARHVHSNSQDLQEFHLWSYNLLIHTVFPDILYKASNLMVLRVPLLSLPRDVTDTPMTPTAQAIFQLPWATTSLRVLELHILGVPRPDISVGEFGKPVKGALFEGTVQESHTVQRAVYIQLAKQAEMEELVLGNGHYYKGQGERVIDAQGRSLYGGPGFQLNCLAMSLESGLDILGGLSKLRVLDLSRTAHRVGVPELEWMQAHWGRIERVSGLFNRRYPGEPGVRDWMAEQDPIWGSEYQSYVFSADGLCGVPNDSVHRDAIAVFHC